MRNGTRKGIQAGDLVVVRFDNSLRVGIVTGRSRPGWLSFIYAEKARPYEKSKEGRLHTTSLPRTRFLMVFAGGGVGNLCNLAANTVWLANDKDRQKLERWCRKFPCNHNGVHGAILAVTNGIGSRDLATMEQNKYRRTR